MKNSLGIVFENMCQTYKLLQKYSTGIQYWNAIYQYSYSIPKII